MATLPFGRTRAATSTRPVAPHASVRRLFVASAVATLIPVTIIGLLLGAGYRRHAIDQGLAEGRAEAVLIATTSIGPALDGRPLSSGLRPEEAARIRSIVGHAWEGRNVLRLRLRTLDGAIVYSSDASRSDSGASVSALAAARGQTIVKLTTLNADEDTAGSPGPKAVEVYLPLLATPHQRIGVLELYLPYSPIAAAAASGVGTLSRDLALSLGLLYLVLFAISLRVTRRLRRQAIVNAHLAEHDPLTDLPNRARFHREVEDAVRDAERGHFSVVAVLDLDRFKEVNDSLGHINGDALLVALAKRLDRAITAPSTVARIGGDEFGVVIRGCPDPYHFLVALRRVVEEEIEISGLPLSIEASVGFTLLEDEPLTMKEILQRADIAMYSAKEHHTGVSVYEATMARHDAANLGLVAELRRAIDDDQLVLHYQPEATLSDGRVRAIEALVRWRHPTLGLLGPDSFLPLAEQTDIIESLTTWVVRRALADLHRLPAAISVAVNISARTLTRLDFADEVALACADAGIDPRRLIIEVTETALMTDPERAALVLSALAATGIHIALDDFGVGQTSLGYLSLLPVHELKIDRSFVSDMQEDEKHRAIVRSIVELGHNLSLEVIGEGVETASVLDSLERVGCDMVQGYYLARPMEITALVEWLVAAEAPAIGV